VRQRHRQRDGLTVPVERILARIGAGLLSIFGALTIVFLLSRLTGDPAELMAPPGAPEAQIEQTRAQLGLDRPLPAQYADFVSDLVRGDLGDSYFWRQDALDLVLDSLPNTILLAVSATVYAVVVGVSLGLLTAFRHRRLVDRGLTSAAMVGQSLPSFWLGPVLILLFAVEWQLLPASGMDGWKSLILPTITLGSFQLAVLLRMTRASALEALGQDSMRLARAKGAGELRIAVGHVLPTTALPILTLSGLALASLIGGSVIAESIFSWPGIGNLMIRAVETRDFPVVQAVALVFSIGFITINTVVDLLYLVVDPRLRETSAL
jgi:peptide/nickel transport system permease protein